MVTSNPSSPSHFSLAANFSADDIHELLGAMSGEHRLSSTACCGEDERTRGTSVERPEDNEEEDDNNIDDGAKAQARSERKRSREKQRRSDVNKQFSDLTEVLQRIETEEAEEDHSVVRLAFSPTNRVDLIARTITHLERLNASNKRRKAEIESLQQQLAHAKKAGEDTAAKLKEVMFNQPPSTKQVMMMVPMMVSADGSTSYGGAAPQTMPMMGNPFMMSQPYMMPQVPQAQPPNTSGMPQQLNQQQQHHQPVMLQQPQHNPFSGYAMAPQQQQQQHQPQQSSQDNSTTNAVPAPAPVPVQPQHPTGMQFMQNNMTSHMGMPGNFVMGPNGMMMMMAPLQNGAPNNQYQTTAAPMMISTPAPADNNTSSTGNVDAVLGNATVATTGRDGNGSSNSSTDSKTPASGGQGTTGSNLAHCA